MFGFSFSNKIITHFPTLLSNQQKSETKTFCNHTVRLIIFTRCSLEVGISLNRSVQRQILSKPSTSDQRQLNKALIIITTAQNNNAQN